MQTRSRRYPPHRLLVAALAIAALLRIGWIIWALGAGVGPVSDAGWYYARAMEIAAGQGYAVDGSPTAYWPVGYPGFLGLLFMVTGPSQTAAMIANLLFYCGAMVAVHAIARKMFASDRAAGIAALILAVYPNHIAYSSLLLSESLFLFLLMGGVAVLIEARGRTPLLWMAGAAFGLATLVKPQAIVIPALCFLAGWLGTRQRRPSPELRKGVVIGYLVVLVTIAPWMLRNRSVFGEGTFLSTNDGINLFIGNNPFANGTYLINDSLERAIYKGAAGEPARNRAARDYALRYIGSHPAEALARVPRKLWYLYRADAEGFSWNIRSLPDGSRAQTLFLDRMKIVAQLCYLLLASAFAASLVLIPRWGGLASRTPYRLAGVWIVLYFTAIPIVYFGDGRFHFPVIPWMAIGAGGLLHLIIERRSRMIPRTGHEAAKG